MLLSLLLNICFVCAVAPKQVDYMNEVKEFEAEMRKHSHKFPHDILTYYTVAHNIICTLCSFMSKVVSLTQFLTGLSLPGIHSKVPEHTRASCLSGTHHTAQANFTG